ncbi:MAG: extracellular solute-binding protein [Bifidobacteriaceae bacterium]|jgi:putative spermidine/putrescine transport system substrate-binding protein|nr:extracellular solute-binding protein [Bifidobacteriaceae bacterium]
MASTNPSTKNHRAPALIAAAGLALTLAGCSDKGNEAETKTETETEATTSAPAAAGDAQTTPQAAGPELSGQVVFADWGGATHDARQAAYFDSFTAGTGVEVVSTTLEMTIMYSMLAGETGDYDAMHVGLPDIYLSSDHLLTLDPTVPRADQLPADAQDYAFGAFAVGDVQAHLAATFPDGGPQTWADFFDTEKYPGKRALPGAGAMNGFVLEAALMADGVAPEDFYPIDYERAYAKLNSIAGDVVFYTEYPQLQQLLLSGSVAVAYGPSGQFTSLIASGEDVTVSWDEAFCSYDAIVIPEQAPNPANIQALAAWMGDPERQAQFARATKYGPLSAAVWEFIPADEQDLIVTAPSHTNLVQTDPQARATYNEEMINAYAEWLTTAQ